MIELSGSFLAFGAEIRRALPLCELFDGRPANPARLACTLIYEALLPEVAGLAVSANIVPKRSAARLDRERQHGSNGTYEFAGFLARQTLRLPARFDASPEQRLARVNVPNAHDQRTVHDELFDGDAATARHLVQIVR